VRRHANDDPVPAWLEDDVAAATRALLSTLPAPNASKHR
jgi:hypothetical protein